MRSFKWGMITSTDLYIGMLVIVSRQLGGGGSDILCCSNVSQLSIFGFCEVNTLNDILDLPCKSISLQMHMFEVL